MNAFELTIPLGLGLVSSLHCSQMCGPIVLSYSLPLQSAGRRAAGAHLSYNAGRLATYSALGAVAGLLGGGIDSMGNLAGLQRGGTLVAGVAMVVAGLLVLGSLALKRNLSIGAAPSWYTRASGRLMRAGSGSNKLILGMLMGLLPCGMVYAALLKAVDTGSALGGALSMLAFGIGTSAALLAIGFFSSALTSRLGGWANHLAGISMLILGAYLIYTGLRMGGGPAGHGMQHEQSH